MVKRVLYPHQSSQNCSYKFLTGKHRLYAKVQLSRVIAKISNLAFFARSDFFQGILLKSLIQRSLKLKKLSVTGRKRGVYIFRKLFVSYLLLWKMRWCEKITILKNVCNNNFCATNYKFLINFYNINQSFQSKIS